MWVTRISHFVVLKLLTRCVWLDRVDSSRLLHGQGDGWTAVQDPGGYQLGRRPDAEGDVTRSQLVAELCLTHRCRTLTL